MFEATDCGARVSGVRETVGRRATGGGLVFALRETVGEFRAWFEDTVEGRVD